MATSTSCTAAAHVKAVSRSDVAFMPDDECVAHWQALPHASACSNAYKRGASAASGSSSRFRAQATAFRITSMTPHPAAYSSSRTQDQSNDMRSADVVDIAFPSTSAGTECCADTGLTSE